MDPQWHIAFCNVTFVETQFRAGGFGPFGTGLPVISGNGVGGVVASVGAGVDERLVGKRVVSGTGGSGGYAELVAVDASGIFGVPDNLALDSAVALLADGRTATMLVDQVRLRGGEVALVEADGRGWGYNFHVTTQWAEVTVPLSEFFLLWNAEKRGDDDRAHPENLDRLSLCFGSWLFPETKDDPHWLEIESVELVRMQPEAGAP